MATTAGKWWWPGGSGRVGEGVEGQRKKCEKIRGTTNGETGSRQVGNRTDSRRLPIEIERDTGVDRGERITVTAKASTNNAFPWQAGSGEGGPPSTAGRLVPDDWTRLPVPPGAVRCGARQRRRRANLAPAAASSGTGGWGCAQGRRGPTTSVLRLSAPYSIVIL